MHARTHARTARACAARARMKDSDGARLGLPAKRKRRVPPHSLSASSVEGLDDTSFGRVRDRASPNPLNSQVAGVRYCNLDVGTKRYYRGVQYSIKLYSTRRARRRRRRARRS